GQALEPGGGLGRRQRPAGQAAVQAAALDVLQCEVRARRAGADVVLADFEELDDAGGLQARHGLGLRAEAPALRPVGAVAAPTRRSRRGRALYTTPMPPRPISPRIS